MPETLITQAEIHSREYTSLIEQQQALEGNIRRQETFLEQNKPFADLLYGNLRKTNPDTGNYALDDAFEKALKEALKEQFPDFIPDTMPAHIQDMAVRARGFLENAVTTAANGCSNAQDRINASKRDLRITKEHLEGMDSKPQLYERDEIESKLINVEGVVPGSVRLVNHTHRFGGESTLLVWNMEPGQASVNNIDLSRYPWFHMDKIEVPYGETEIRVNLHTKEIRILPVNSDEAYYSWEGTKTAHPHILNGHSPCLGDFGGPMTEAIVQRDWETVGTLLNLFLSQIDNTDSAGAHWRHYFSFKYGDRYVSRREGMPRSRRGYRHYFRDEADEIYMKLSRTPYQFEELEQTTIEEVEKIAEELGITRPRVTITETTAA